MAALAYVDVPGYSALILRRTWPDLNSPGAVLDRFTEWMAPFTNTKEVHKGDGGRIWTFPSGAKVQFGYAQRPEAKYKFQGCLTADHEVLTDRGWVPISEVATGDTVASLDPETRQASMQRVLQTHKYNYSGKMLNIHQQNGVSLCMTPNHRNLVSTYKNADLKYVFAEDLKKTNQIPQSAVSWDAKPAPEFVELQGRFSGRTSRRPEPLTAEWRHYAELVGWIIAEGNRADKSNGISITQLNSSGVDRIRYLLDSIGISYRYDGKRFRFSNETLANLVGRARSWEKSIPREFFQYRPEDLSPLLWSLVEGDGTWYRDDYAQYTTTSYQLASDVQELAVRCGWKATITKGAPRPEDNRFGPGREFWKVWLTKPKKDMQLGGQIDNWTETNPSGKVYCLSVETNNNFMVRHNGRVAFTGNSEYNFVGFDEATQFEPEIYEYLGTRIRRPKISCLVCTAPLTRYNVDGDVRYRHGKTQQGCDAPIPDPAIIAQYPPAPDGTTIFDVPLRMRATANPGGLAHEFFRKRFIDKDTRRKDSVFIPSALKDNPSLDTEEYQRSLEGLSLVDRERLLNGNWEIMDSGNLFDRGDFETTWGIEEKEVKQRVRCWDFAASDNKDADYTVGVLVAMTHDNRLIVEDVKRFQKLPKDTERIVKETAVEDGIETKIYIEQEPGSAGKTVASYYARHVLGGFQFKAIRATGSKTDRAGALVSQVAARNVYLVDANWNVDLMNEAVAFPSGPNDDQVDALALAVNVLMVPTKRKFRIVV